jgi:hypothetical protein
VIEDWELNRYCEWRHNVDDSPDDHGEEVPLPFVTSSIRSSVGRPARTQVHQHSIGLRGA